MVNITSIYDAVTWPEDEGVLGVVGVAPYATLDFCQQLYALTEVDKEWQYPRVIIDNNSKIPSRGRHLQLGERDPSPFIKATIAELAQMGATVAVVPCNTAHILWPRWGRDTAIPVVNIVDATVNTYASHHGLVTLLGSEMLVASQIYSAGLSEKGGEIIALNASWQQCISDCIAAIKVARCLPARMMKRLHDIVATMQDQGVTTVLLACTELSLLKNEPLWQGLTVIDSNESLARAALEAIAYKKIR